MSNPEPENFVAPTATPSAVPRIVAGQEIQGEGEPWDFKNVLSLDGGGIRGYYSLLYLRLLMVYIKQAELNFIDGNGNQIPARSSFHPHMRPEHTSHSLAETHYFPYHYFDYICGTSTGGLISIMLSRLRMGVEDCIDEYLHLGGSVFGSPRIFHSMTVPFLTKRTKYRSKLLTAAIQQVIRKHDDSRTEHTEHLFKSHPRACQTFVCAFKENSLQNNIASGLWIFRSYDHFRGAGRSDVQQGTFPRNPGPASTIQVWQAARATSAAPFYFKALKIYTSQERPQGGRIASFGPNTPPDATFMDGGFGVANNPSTEIYQELLKSNEPIGTFVSVGTGRKNPERFQTGILNQIRAGFDALGDTEVAHTAMQQYSEHDGFRYFRFNEPESLKDMDFDEWKGPQGRATIEKMDKVFALFAMQPIIQDKIRACAHQLVRRRRLRAALDPSRWECYALGSFFYCNLQSCSVERDKRWDRRDEFEHHLRDVHERGRDMVDNNAREEFVNGFRNVWDYPAPHAQMNGNA